MDKFKKTKKPNIVFFFTDDQRFDTIGALGNDQIITPNFDALVLRGTAFTHAHIPCGTAGAVCMPSRAMLNTGRTLFHIEGAGKNIPKEHTTLGQALRENGYKTFGTGKWHNGHESFNRSFSDGAEICFLGMADHWNVPVYNYDPTGKYDSVCPEVKDPRYSNEVTLRECDHITAGKHSTDLFHDTALNFIKDSDGSEPFYLYLSFMAPHDPRTMPKKYRDMYDAEKIKLPPNFMGSHPFDNGGSHNRDEKLACFPRTPEETRRHIAEYYAMITHLDDQFGSVVAALEEKGILDETIIVFAGDNGLALGQHGLFGKQNCYEHSVRVPLVFAGPGIPKNTKTDASAYLFDIFATLCELSGTNIPASVEGISLVEAMNDPNQKVRRTLYFAYTDVHRAVKHDGYKLIEYVVGHKHTMTQLFDLENDPYELNNLADSPSHADKLSLMREKLRQCRDEWDDEKSPWGERFWAGMKK